MEEAKWVAGDPGLSSPLSYLPRFRPFKNPADLQRVLADLAKAGVK